MLSTVQAMPTNLKGGLTGFLLQLVGTKAKITLVS